MLLCRIVQNLPSGKRTDGDKLNKMKTMYKTILFLAAFCVSAATAFAQDIITLKSGEDIQATVQEVGIGEVKYKNFDNPDGPSYTIKKSDVFMIRYANGSKDVFKDEAPTNQAVVGTDEKPDFLQMNDNQQEQYLQVNYPDLYERFHTGQKLSSIGRGLAIPGLCLIGSGLVLMLIAVGNIDSDYSSDNNNDSGYRALDKAGAVILCVGGALAL